MDLSNLTKKEVEQIGKEIKSEALNKAVGYITAAFGFVAGLAWNDAIKALLEYLFPLSGNVVLAKFIYALLVTIVVVIITTYLLKPFDNKEKK